MNPNNFTQESAPLPQEQPNTPQTQVSIPVAAVLSSKKRAKFWLFGPAISLVAGFAVVFVNSFIGIDGLHLILNRVGFLLIAPAGLALIPGVIYGVVLLAKK